ncbi:N-acetyllactosaminide beta-1,3-N-acetylglucosaminyltransferase 4-like [Littorina saxatilis]|uniref:N-acetyllactosaminide beta-1,3-N-acetylglucosaminyltransferase 4-like n=1 Tax=Littorina saxatilis TaxID=31220 RepID=UPI0038B63E24
MLFCLAGLLVWVAKLGMLGLMVLVVLLGVFGLLVLATEFGLDVLRSFPLQFQRWRVRYLRRWSWLQCMLLLVSMVTLYRVTSQWWPSNVTASPQRNKPRIATDRDVFAAHFMVGFRFRANGSQGVGDGVGSYRPRLPDDRPQFFQPRSQAQFSLDVYPYLHEARDTCDGPVDLLVLVPSSPAHLQRRQAVRHTWGSAVSGKPWAGDTEDLGGSVVVLFLLGQVKDDRAVSEAFSREAQEHGDVVQWQGLLDTYYNLTLKVRSLHIDYNKLCLLQVLLGLRWVRQHCRHARHVIKADDDTFVHVPRVLRRAWSPGWADSISGAFYKASPCRRTGRYAVSRAAYPFDVYPPHVKGNVYVVPGEVVQRLVLVAPYLPYNNMEDVHVTGTLPRALGLSHHPFLQREFSVLPRPPHPCVFMDDVTLASQQVNPQLAYRIWATFTDGRLCPSANL